jgi:O-antigen/teichoic acid export membrane protein
MTLNILANLVGRVAALALTLLFLPIFLRLFGAESFGLIVIATSIFFIIPMLDAGFGITLNKLTAQAITKPDGSADVAIALKSFQKVTALITATLIFLAPLFGYFAGLLWDVPTTLSTHTVFICITLTVISAAIRLFCLSHIGVLMGAEKQVFLNIINTAGSLVKTVGTLIVTLFWHNIIAYFICMLLEALLVAICTYVKAWSFVGRTNVELKGTNVIGQHSTFFGFMAANTALLTLLSQMDRLISSTILTLDGVGIYGVAAMLSSAAISISYPAAFAAMPRFAALYAENKPKKIAELHHNLQMVTICVFGPACGIVIAYAKPLLALYLGEEHLAEQASTYLRILCLAIFSTSLMSTTYYMAVTSNRVKSLFLANMILITISALAMLIAGIREGARGIALVVAVNSVCHLIAVSFVVRLELGVGKIIKLLCIGFGVFLLSSLGAHGLASYAALPIWCLPVLSILASFGFALCIPETRYLISALSQRLGYIRRRRSDAK